MAIALELELSEAAGVSVGRLRWALMMGLALLARSLVLLGIHRQGLAVWLTGQSYELGRLSASLSKGHGLQSPFGGSTGPTAFLAPGFPVFVSLFYRMFGGMNERSALAILVVQMLFGVGTVALLMMLTRRLFGTREANLAGAFWALSPTLIWLPALFWETSLSIFALTGAVLLLLVCVERTSTGLWGALGLVMGLTLLVNPSLALVMVAMLAWGAYRQRATWWRGPIIAALLCLAVYAPWPVRNLRVMHAVIPFRSSFGYELWQGNRMESQGYFNKRRFPDQDPAEFQRYVKLGEVGYMHEKAQLGEQVIEAHPVRFVALTLKRIGLFWVGLGTEMWSGLMAAHIVVTTLLGLCGLASMIRERRADGVLLLLLVGLYPLPYYVTHADPRFRLVLDPLLAMLSAAVVVRWIGAARES